MRFSFPTEEQKREGKRTRLRAWHKKFAWKPTRMTNDPTVVVFLEFILRRGRIVGYTDSKPNWEWTYAESSLDILRDGNNK